MDSEKPLTNEDFRKLFMTPRHPGDGGSSTKANDSLPPPSTPSASVLLNKNARDKEKLELRKKKKQFYSKIKKEEDDQLAELQKKYRDRAKERREGTSNDQREDLITAQGGYRAVAPDFRGNLDAAERRKQMIQESKYLGGDIEHTHLVKGLDYALLQKVRSELDNEGEEEKEEEEEEKKEETVSKVPQKPAANEEVFRTKIARNLHRVLFKSAPPERNELMAPGRMAYVFELDDEYAESDIPTTLIRSKADVPLTEGQATLTTNDIVINKLAQILSYLRQGSKNSKKQKKNKEIKNENQASKSLRLDPKKEVDIYDGIGDYVPTGKKESKSTRKEKEGKSYFDKNEEEDKDDKYTKDGTRKKDREVWSTEDAVNKDDITFGSVLKKDEKFMSKSQKLLKKINAQPEGYNECYPGYEEMHDAIEDSDDEVDYSKMDPGKKKAAIGRWDFDTVEEYSEYMSNKEALPKAAFQFGVKMNDGRKTRKGVPKEKNEKAELDRQWQKIQNIIEKRKASGRDGGGDPKTPRYT